MSNQWNAPRWADGDFTAASPVSLPVFSSPIAATTKEYLLMQDFMQYRANFSALALNTAHPSSGLTPDYSAFKLVSEGDRRDIQGGVVKWTRTYGIAPDSYSDFETYPYGFIGSATILPDATIVTRLTQVWNVPTRLQHDFFLVGSGLTYTDAGAIPKILAMRYVYQAVIGGATFGGVINETQQLNPVGSTLQTWPTSDQYNLMIADALANGWSATVSNVILETSNTLSGGPPPTSGHMAGTVKTGQLGTAVLDTGSGGNSTLGGQIPVEDSKIVRWQGNIWERITRYALAQ